MVFTGGFSGRVSHPEGRGEGEKKKMGGEKKKMGGEKKMGGGGETGMLLEVQSCLVIH